MRQHAHNRPRGFIALMSAVIISAILMVVVVAGSMSGFATRFNLLDGEAKEGSAALVDACVDILLSRLAQGLTPNDPVTQASCRILNAASPYQISATYDRAHTDALVDVDASNAIVSWQEVGNF